VCLDWASWRQPHPAPLPRQTTGAIFVIIQSKVLAIMVTDGMLNGNLLRGGMRSIELDTSLVTAAVEKEGFRLHWKVKLRASARRGS
jgi:hypothetical protein